MSWSSLWEIDTLRHHYCPLVSRFVLSLENDLTRVIFSGWTFQSDNNKSSEEIDTKNSAERQSDMLND
ncbi:nucleolar complex protein 4 [Artemisia annua]|uniref:Nucleolar complex protein 4 n=1 Tax=Artemisia annua TaxID=35608 RepID=A0A2U1NFD9_ARTAN|nr:nucleolar complex protein 4 [Artemisia annua]